MIATAKPPRAVLQLHVLASGSKGNAAIVENTRTGQGILIDCGICKRDFLGRCEQLGLDPTRLEAVLVTHDHTDHTKGLPVVLRGLAKTRVHLELFAERAVRDASSQLRECLDQDLCAFSPIGPESCLDIGGIGVTAFATSHDAASSLGFRFQAGGDALGFMTDTGTVTPPALEALQDVRVLGIESNHDQSMLAECDYPYHLKQRIASDSGHLSNDQAAATLEALLHPGLQQVVALHVSQNANTYRAPREALQAILDRHGHGAQVIVAFQDRPVSTATPRRPHDTGR